MLVANLSLAAAYSTSIVPYGDEVHTVTASLTPSWLWAQHAEHRIPLPKLIWLGVLKLTDYDFRVGNLLHVLAVGAVVFLMVRFAGSLRGRTSYADAFFPLAMLNFGQALNFLWWWQVNQTLAPLVACLLLLLIASRDTRVSFRNIVLAGFCLILLPLCGPGGLLYPLALSLWLGFWCLINCSPGETTRYRKPLVAFGLGAAAVLLVGLCFYGYDLEGTAQGSHQDFNAVGLRATLVTTIKILSISLGTAANEYWRYSGLAMLALCLISGALLVVGLTKPQERFRAMGLLLFMAATGAGLLVIAWARASLGDYVLTGHYLLRVVLLLCCAYFVWEIYGGSNLGPFVQMSLFTVACLLLVQNVRHGVAVGEVWFQPSRELERDLLARVPPFILGERYGEYLNEGFDATLGAEFFRTLSERKIGRFKLMRPDPEFREVPFAAEPISTNHATWENGIVHAKGIDPFLVFRLDKPRQVYAIRFTYCYKTPGPAAFKVLWKNSELNEFTETARACHLQLNLERARVYEKEKPEEETVTVWVDDTIDQFRINPDDKPCLFKLSKIALLVPETQMLAAEPENK
jgi:hypothetical protein